MKRIKFQLFLVLLIGILSNVNAQFQRMGIRKGTSLSIPANSQGKVNTYCMDYTLEAPKSGTIYQKILSDPSAARVKFDGESSKSLQEAIDAGEIVLEGTSWTLDYIMENSDNPSFTSRLRPEVVEELNELKQMWYLLSKSQKDELIAEFGQLGDHTQMQLINKTGKIVTLSFIDNAIIGVDNKVKLGSLSSSLLNDKVQADVWYFSNLEHQKKLKALGFYNGKINGNIDSVTKKAIKDFQIQNGLEPSGLIDSETDQLLLEAFDHKIEENKRLQEYFRANGDYNGEIDGVFGKKIHESIDSFKAKNGLSKYDIEVIFRNDNVHAKFKNQNDFIDYYKNLDEECHPEFCLSDDMSISFSNNCLPVSASVSVSGGLNLTIEAGAISYNIALFADDAQSQNDDECRLAKGACFSSTLERDYSIQCNEDVGPIEVSATQVFLSVENVSVSLFE